MPDAHPAVRTLADRIAELCAGETPAAVLTACTAVIVVVIEHLPETQARRAGRDVVRAVGDAAWGEREG